MILAEIKHYIDNSESILILSHIEGDGDSLGSMTGLKRSLIQAGKKVFTPAPNSFPERYLFMQKYCNGWGILPAKIDLIVTVDCSVPDRIDWGDFIPDKETPIVNIDHHDGNPAFGSCNWIDPNASATAEMVSELIEYLGTPIDANTASALFVGILTDTGRFSFSNTTAKSLATASRLQEYGADPKFLTSEVYFNFSEEYMKNIGIALFNSKSFHNGRILFLNLDRASTQNFSTSPNDSEGIIDFAMAVRNVDVAILFKEISQKLIRVSLRSRRGINISLVAEFFKGGGHPNAAGCTIEGNLAIAQEAVLFQIRKLLGYR